MVLLCHVPDRTVRFSLPIDSPDHKKEQPVALHGPDKNSAFDHAENFFMRSNGKPREFLSVSGLWDSRFFLPSHLKFHERRFPIGADKNIGLA